ncbi:MAG: RagB/SusD family nutrient uptake outer membrane protein [Bacteroidia bacterium]|nr:MAG: RagB/SusD family nutrient uptake outer membrane protein [Bacteroidia bacterium]
MQCSYPKAKRNNTITYSFSFTVKFFFSLLVFLLMSSCEDFLERDPLDQITTANFYQTPENAIAGVNAAYTPLYLLYQESRMWTFDFMGDDADKAGGGPGDRAFVTQLISFEFQTNNEVLYDIWRFGYRGVYYANVAIEKISGDDIEMDDQLRERLLGESYYLRGLYHFFLVRIFGDIPLYTAVPDPNDLHVSRTPKELVYQQIIEDLELAGSKLHAIPLSNEKGRATKGSAYGMLARVHLTLENWQECIDACNEVHDIGYHILMPDYKDLFNRISNENNPESLFEIQFKYDEVARYGGSGNMIPEFIAPRYGSRFANSGWGWGGATQAYIDLFDAEDLRKPVILLSPGDSVQMPNGNYWVYDPDNIQGLEHNPTNTYFRKLFDYGYIDNVTGMMMNSSINHYIQRYTDVVLMHAEALNELGNQSQALDYLNQIRERAFGNSNHNYSNLSQDEIREAIFIERRIEFVMEQNRWYDIVRKGPDIAEQILHAAGKESFDKNIHLIFPIPQREIDLNPNLLPQNPGYD